MDAMHILYNVRVRMAAERIILTNNTEQCCYQQYLHFWLQEIREWSV